MWVERLFHFLMIPTQLFPLVSIQELFKLRAGICCLYGTTHWLTCALPFWHERHHLTDFVPRVVVVIICHHFSTFSLCICHQQCIKPVQLRWTFTRMPLLQRFLFFLTSRFWSVRNPPGAIWRLFLVVFFSANGRIGVNTCINVV